MLSSWSPPLLDPLLGYRAGRATLLRVAQTLLEPLLALRRRPTRAGQMRATRPAWAAEMRATSRAPGPSLARIGPTRNETSSRCPDLAQRGHHGRVEQSQEHPHLVALDVAIRRTAKFA